MDIVAGNISIADSPNGWDLLLLMCTWANFTPGSSQILELC